MTDIINHPEHYTSHPSGVECLTVTREMNFNLGNAIKYIWRADLKNDAIEDLHKARFYISDEIDRRTAPSPLADFDPAAVADKLLGVNEFPRKMWRKLEDVPKDVRVLDNDDDVYEFRDGDWYWWDLDEEEWHVSECDCAEDSGCEWDRANGPYRLKADLARD